MPKDVQLGEYEMEAFNGLDSLILSFVVLLLFRVDSSGVRGNYGRHGTWEVELFPVLLPMQGQEIQLEP